MSFPSAGMLYVGESTLKNALPYDEIAKASFSPVSQMKGINTLLEKDHEERMQANPEFLALKEGIEKFKEANAKKSLVLDLKKYEAMQGEQERRDLKRINEHRALQGLKPVTSIEGVTKSKVDYIKDESLQVTAELVNNQHK